MALAPIKPKARARQTMHDLGPKRQKQADRATGKPAPRKEGIFGKPSAPTPFYPNPRPTSKGRSRKAT